MKEDIFNYLNLTILLFVNIIPISLGIINSNIIIYLYIYLYIYINICVCMCVCVCVGVCVCVFTNYTILNPLFV